MPYHISDKQTLSLCKARPGKCPLGDGMQNHFSDAGLKRILGGTPLRTDEVDICLRLKSGELALDYTIPGEAADPTIKRLARPSRLKTAGGTPVYANEEAGIRGLFKAGSTYTRNGQQYEVISCDKPQVGGGEPKADMFIAARNISTGKVDAIKISYKMNSGEFGENKLSAEQAQRILGDQYKTIIKDAAEKLRLPERVAKHDSRMLYPLGYRLDIMLPKHGRPAANSSYVPIELDQAALDKIYTGRGSAKADAYVTNHNGNMLVKDAGVADYILFEQDCASAQDVIDKMIPISEHIKAQPQVFIALKAINYRMDKHRKGERAWDGNRSLAVPVDWELTARNELVPTVNLDQIFDHKADFRGAALKRLLVRSNRG